MSKPLIVGCIKSSELKTDGLLSYRVLQACHTIHLTDGLLGMESIQDVQHLVQQLSYSKAPIKLSMSLRGTDNTRKSTQYDAQLSCELEDKIKQYINALEYIDLNCELDLTPQILSAIPAHKRIITCHTNGFNSCLERYKSLKHINAFLYRFICEDGMAALEFLHHINQKNVIAYDDRIEGLWSRICAFYKGATIIFTKLDSAHASLYGRLSNVFNSNNLPHKIDHLYGIVGSSISKSFSPLVHNKGLRELKIPAVYLPFQITELNKFNDYRSRLKKIGLPFQGLTITAPLKATMNSAYTAQRAIIEKTLSANVFVLKEGEGYVDTTDDIGLTQVLNQHKIIVKDMQVALIGCGNSGRVVAYTLKVLGAQVALYNRSPERGKMAEYLLGLPYYPLEQLNPENFDLIVNTAPFTNINDVTFPVNNLNKKTLVIDYVYNPYPNGFMACARLKNLKIIDGFEMLKYQITAQFQCLTGRNLPIHAKQFLKEILIDRKNNYETSKSGSEIFIGNSKKRTLVANL